MRRLGAVSGRGTAVYDDQTAIVDYEIAVYAEGGLKSARGSIGAPWRTLNDVFRSKAAKLTLESGGSVDFFITRYGAPDDVAEIVVSGPVPGF